MRVPCLCMSYHGIRRKLDRQMTDKYNLKKKKNFKAMRKNPVYHRVNLLLVRCPSMAICPLYSSKSSVT